MQVFSAFGTVQKIAIFEKSAGFQALVQYPGATLCFLNVVVGGSTNDATLCC